MRQINKDGIDLIKRFEGCRLEAYYDIVGVLTIGYGHTGPGLWKGQKISQSMADIILDNDLVKFCSQVEDLVKVPLTDNQFGALVSFSYNLGSGALKSSTLLKRINLKDSKASEEFLKWNKAGGKVVEGLTRRRQSEKELFDAK